MKSQFSGKSFLWMLIILLLAACASSSGDAGQVEDQAAAEPQAESDAPPADDQPEESKESGEAQPPLATPDNPTETVSEIHDASSKDSAPQKTTSGDILYINLLERPFSRGEMDYFGLIDIVTAELSFDNDWGYVIITVEEPLDGPQASLRPAFGKSHQRKQLFYAVEFDFDLDNRADLLIVANLTPGSDWSLQGVSIYEDQNKDYGGNRPRFPEFPRPEWNGFETLLSSDGQGEVSNAAWVRKSPSNDQQIEIAFSRSLLDSEVFFWAAWDGSIDPSIFEQNDFMHPRQAGSPILDSKFYPVRDLQLIDNTCRQLYGAEITEPRPGLCGVEILGFHSPGQSVSSDQPPDDAAYPDTPQDDTPDDTKGDDDDDTRGDDDDDDTPRATDEPQATDKPEATDEPDDLNRGQPGYTDTPEEEDYPDEEDEENQTTIFLGFEGRTFDFTPGSD